MIKIPKRLYLSVDDIQEEVLPISKKKIREYMNILPHCRIGGRMYVRRDIIEDWLEHKKESENTVLSE